MDMIEDTAVVLVAEDDEDDCLFISEALKGAASNIELLFLKTGLDLINFLREGQIRPDLILLDLNMPVMGGKEALVEIQSDQTLRDLPVVILTTSSEDEDRRFCLDRGAKAFFTKPAGLAQLSGLLESLIKQFVTN
jgi:CheY-like chemotaxis protein